MPPKEAITTKPSSRGSAHSGVVRGLPVARPVVVNRETLVSGEIIRDSELSFYCEHVVFELRQFYNGEYVKGAIVAATSLAGLVFGGTELVRLLVGLMGARTGPEPISAWRAVLGFMGFFAWIYGLIDAPVRARKLSEEGRGGGDFF